MIIHLSTHLSTLDFSWKNVKIVNQMFHTFVISCYSSSCVVAVVYHGTLGILCSLFHIFLAAFMFR